MTCPEKSAVLVGPLLGLMLGLGGCRGDTVDYDCEDQATDLFERQDEEAPELVAPIPEDGPVPVAVALSSEGINRLLQSAILDQETPFAGAIPIATAEAVFTPESDPVIQLIDVPGCRECIVFEVDFNVEIENLGEPLAAGPGHVELVIPLYLTSDEAAGMTTLYADYSSATIRTLDLAIFGFDTGEHQGLAGALQIRLEERIQEQFEPIELMSIGSWMIGNGDVKLLAKDVVVYPDSDKLLLAMRTNLSLPYEAHLDLEVPLPDGVPMVVSMHPDLFLAMSHRMLTEGEIPRRYDQDGNPDPEGPMAVSITSMNGSDSGVDRIDTRFRVWRIADGYCGWAEADMPLNLELNTANNGFDVVPGEPALVVDDDNCEGSGCLAPEEEELVEKNKDLVDNFRDSLADQVGQTINYDAMNLDGSTIVFGIVDLVVSSDTIDTQLDFTVVKNAE